MGLNRTLPKWLLITIIIALSVVLASGCGQKNAASEAETGETAQGEKYPDRPITVIINYGAGGQTDVVVRLLAKAAEKQLGVPLVIENKAGGGGSIGINDFVRAKPDGYTIGSVTTGAITVMPAMQDVGYDSFKDIRYLAGFGSYHYAVYVRTDSPYNSIQDIVEAARKNPGKITYGAVTAGNAVGLEYVANQEDISLAYMPFKSGQELAVALASGNVEVAIDSPEPFEQFIDTGKLKVIAIAEMDRWTEEKYKDVPTLAELGYNVDITGWMGLAVPAGVPEERVKVLSDALEKAYNDPDYQQGVKNLKLFAPYKTGEELKKIYEDRYHEWLPIVEVMKEKMAQK